jgi:hypothetical protein
VGHHVYTKGLVILLYTLSQRNRRLGLEWSVME